MPQPSIGDYVLYQQWPAVVCPGTLAPLHIAAKRPNGFNHLILMIKDQPEFRYVVAQELQTLYDLSPDPETTRQVEGLQRAYEILHEAISSDFSTLDYWRMAVPPDSRQLGLPTPCSKISPQESDGNLDSDSDSNEEIGRAIQLSLIDQTTIRAPSLTPSPPTPPRFAGRPQGRVGTGNIQSYFKPPGDTTSTSAPKRSAVNKNDIVEGEIAESNQFVEFLVGPEKKQFVIPKSIVFERPYFSNKHINNVRTKANQGWQVSHPALAHIEPEDFAYAADYLCSGDFGFRHIDDATREQAMEQCISAWEVGDQLGMMDLLEHIVAKIENTLPWGSTEVLAFSTVVYRTAGTPLDVYEMMKDMLTDFLADNYYEMLRDHGGEFVRRLRDSPELERDVHRKVALRAEQRMEEEEAETWESLR